MILFLQNQYLLLNGDRGIQLMLKEAFQLPLPFCFQLLQDMLITLDTAIYPGIDTRIYTESRSDTESQNTFFSHIISTISDPICSKILLYLLPFITHSTNIN